LEFWFEVAGLRSQERFFTHGGVDCGGSGAGYAGSLGLSGQTGDVLICRVGMGLLIGGISVRVPFRILGFWSSAGFILNFGLPVVIAVIWRIDLGGVPVERDNGLSNHRTV